MQLQLAHLKWHDAGFAFIGALIVCIATHLEPRAPASHTLAQVGLYLVGGTLCGWLVGGTIKALEESTAWAVLVGATWHPLAIQIKESSSIVGKALANHYSSSRGTTE